MAPSTRSKAAAAAGVSSSARQTRATRKTRQPAKQQAEKAESSTTAAQSVRSPQGAPSNEEQSEEQISVDPVKKDASPITRRFAPRVSPDASTIFLPSEAGQDEPEYLEGSPMPGHNSFFSPPKKRVNRSALEGSEEAEPYALQQATGGEDKGSEVIEILGYVTPEIQRHTSELYKSLILLNNGDQPATRVQIHFALLKAARQAILREGELFVDVLRFHRVLENHEDQNFANNAYHAICTSNIATLLAYLLDTPLDPRKPQEIIDKVANNFPWVFDFSAPREDEDKVARQIDLAFSLRCCYLTSLIREEINEDPYVLATRVFCEDKVESRKAAKQAISQGPYKPLTSPQVPGLSTEEYQARMTQLDGYLSEKRRDKTQSRMEAAYPVEQLAQKLAVWAETTSEKLFAPRPRKFRMRKT
ncbi:hypothetical protein PG994_004785 [Apiospora phragmitis]|uniref:Uncharacterized protein n=1 Tax=Apiospora phragmitis TaxID=2905665 RepID=A0ABR1VRK0_9PEZI